MDKIEAQKLTLTSILIGFIFSISLIISYPYAMKSSVHNITIPTYFTLLLTILVLILGPSYLYLHQYHLQFRRDRFDKGKRKSDKIFKLKKRLNLSGKQKIIILILLLFIIIGGLGGALGYYIATDPSIAKIFEQFTVPIMIVISLELSVPILLFSSFFLNKKFKNITRLFSFSILLSLISFYFFIPYIPINLSPNHPDTNWNHGSVVHILPAASHNRLLIKTSYEHPVSNPTLNVSGTIFNGDMMDTNGYFWRFDAQNLSANTTYQLNLKDSIGNLLCDPWPLKTFPDPNSEPEHLKMVVYTGSGGHDACRSWYEMGQLPLSIRQKIINRAMDFNPDIVIGTGDQIYYDIMYGKGPQILGQSRRAIQFNGRFIPSLDVLGTQNEITLKNAVDCQISYLYGTALKSTPTYFILDDHEYFANDEANKEQSIDPSLLFVWANPIVQKGISFPPNDFMLELGRVAQKLYLPEFLPDENRPLSLPSTNLTGRAVNTSECFGTLRYGKLVEGLLYDVRRYVTGDYTNVSSINASFLPKSAENWLIDRMKAEDAEYVINISPISYGWSAGKWLSWYPDIKTKINGRPTLTTDIEKYAWQEGWFKQHNRILNASFNMENSTDLFLCGDMHTQAAGFINKSGNLNFTSDPIPSVLIGSLGANGGSYPSGGLRGIEAMPPCDLLVDEKLPSYEKSGFVVVDITLDNIIIDFYGWRLSMDRVEEIDDLESHFTFTIKR
ncbi:MAG: hypothetical protein EU547_01650 [Promethearchaeota archaeon]|nr:MAG: hypothetical protein EU547_01650 [Candidatus Lokiarchaeota archaeon]